MTEKDDNVSIPANAADNTNGNAKLQTNATNPLNGHTLGSDMQESQPTRTDDDQRDPVEVLASEYAERRRRGESPQIEDYVQQYPNWADQIRSLFPVVAAIEQAKRESTPVPSSSANYPLEQLGDYRLIREIGRGGMGIVYEAEQSSLRRRVAVKVLPPHLLGDATQVRRFGREAKMAASLHHTNIVPVFGVGEADGHHYYVMQFIPGISVERLLEFIKQSDETSTRNVEFSRFVRRVQEEESVQHRDPWLPVGQSGVSHSTRREKVSPTHPTPPLHNELANAPSQPPAANTNGRAQPRNKPAFDRTYWHEVAQIGIQSARALAYAHAQGVLHRDVKPGNLLLDPRGVVWVADFGLAKAIEGDELSQADIAGTLRYMAPERFNGDVDFHTDVYGLGLTLYELATLTFAFGDCKSNGLVQKISRGELPRPSRIRRRIPRDLETIILKAIAPDPRHRYQSAEALAEDLQCFLDDRPIRARRVSVIEHSYRWIRRNKLVSALATVVAVLLVAVAGIASNRYFEIRAANEATQTAYDNERDQRLKTEATSALALDALDEMFLRLAPDRSLTGLELDSASIQLPTQPVVSKETAALLERMLQFYDELADQSGDDALVRPRRARALRRIGDIHQRLGQSAKATAAYQQAADVYQRLNNGPSEGKYVIEIARVHNELGRMAQHSESNRKEHLIALRTLKNATTTTMALPECQFELARTYYLLGRRGTVQPDEAPPTGPAPGRKGPDAWRRKFDRLARPDKPDRPPRERHPEGHPPHGKPEKGRPGLFGFGPGGPPPGREHRPGDAPPALSPEGLLDFVPAIGRFPLFRTEGPRRLSQEQVDYLKKAVGVLESLVTDHPRAPEYKFLLACCYRELPPRQSTVQGGPSPRAKAQEILERLSQEYPAVADYRFQLSETYAIVPPGQGSSHTNELNLKQALSISRDLVAEHPNIPDYAASQVHICLRLGDLLRRSKRGHESSEVLREGLETQEQLQQQFPDVKPYKVWQAIVQASLAETLFRPDSSDEALELVERSIEILNEVKHSGDATDHNMNPILSRHLTLLADILHTRGEWQLSRLVMDEAKSLRPNPMD